jgi:uncharacterized membrane protein YhfC
MPATVHVNPLYFAGLVIATVFVIVYPFALAFIARKKLHVGWRYFWFGTLVFLVSQLLTRVPAVTILQNTVLASLLRTSTAFLWTWLVILALTAGIFEEVGRYLGYRIFMRREEKTWNKGVMYGLGHGGLESAVLIGGLLLLSVINLAVYSSTNLNTLSQAKHAQIVQQVNDLNAQPAWTALLGAWERLWTVFIQVALSVIVLQVFRRQAIVWLFIAILAHAGVDFVAVALPQLLGSSTTTSLIVEGVVAIFGLLAIWVIWRLREPEAGITHDGAPGPVVPEVKV